VKWNMGLDMGLDEPVDDDLTMIYALATYKSSRSPRCPPKSDSRHSVRVAAVTGYFREVLSQIGAPEKFQDHDALRLDHDQPTPAADDAVACSVARLLRTRLHRVSSRWLSFRTFSTRNVTWNFRRAFSFPRSMRFLEEAVTSENHF
jgi:hypothetical protein